MNKHLWLAGATGLAVALLAVGWLDGGGGTDAGQAPAPIPRRVVAALGRVEPLSEEVRVAAAMTGRLAEVLVDEGDRVERGQVVARLENADHLARLQAAEAGVRVAQAALERVLNGTRPEERREAAAAVTEAEALAGLSDREAARQQGLAEQKLVSHQSLDAANSEARAARARLERARRHLDLVEAPPREDERAQAEAELAVAQARAAETRAIYEKSLIRSPLQGLVLHRFRRAGEQVTELGDTPILSVGDTSVLRVRAEVDEADLGLIALGRPAWCRAEAWGERRFTGRVSRLGSLMGRKRVHDEQPGERVDTRVMEILIDLDPGSDLPVGLRVDAFIELEAGR